MLKQQLQIKLSQKLSPQQIQLMKLIQLSTLELEQRIFAEIGENPALEKGKEIEEEANPDDQFDDYHEDQKIDTDDIDIDAYLSDDEIPNYRIQANNQSGEEEEKMIPFSGRISFHEYLETQLQNLILTEKERPIAEFLIGSIDNSGYLRRTEEDIIDDLAFTQNIVVDNTELKAVLRKVQSLDPPGVGARSLQECLSIQLARKEKDRPILVLTKKIIDTAFNEFSRKHYKKLQGRFNISEEEVRGVFDEIAKLNPKPGGALSEGSQNNHIVPDFILSIDNGKLKVTLNRRNTPDLRISNSYKEMLAGYAQAPEKNKSMQEAVLFIKQKLDAAKWFIDAIEQRHQTLFLTVNAIVEYQSAYFISGDEQKLRPMILKDIADKIEMDISTVSRVANSKYIDSPYGVKLLKSFFSEGMKNDEGEDVSTIEIKKILKDLIAKENKKKPLADQALSSLLKEKGFNVARRTISKYREQMDIPVARLRKSI
ncbi:MAG: RNA polymerase sigma-54 factor [Gammaproteobacteria bacterium TMED119]|nr:MAG: RNA polymerase sigma-54 factor [Gammaproteobacteria bacterium TMED119]PDH45252.1 MAG: RNA polymerase sigma-54 factor [Flavobacteriales bacterium MED-G15]|tara:strand:+ start:28602 stop:30053 length:1452 start_codon:yes stop_codon:yes gene_type:complete